MPDHKKKNEDSGDPMRELLGEPIYTYGDGQVVEDGALVPFVTNSGDTGHRVTRNALETIRRHYKEQGRSEGGYSEPEFARFVFSELMPLVPDAIKVYDRGGILKTTYEFKVTNREEGVLWYMPNENGGLTIMKPEDY